MDRSWSQAEADEEAGEAAEEEGTEGEEEEGTISGTSDSGGSSVALEDLSSDSEGEGEGGGSAGPGKRVLLDSPEPLEEGWTRAPQGGVWRICPPYYSNNRLLKLSGEGVRGISGCSAS